MRRNAWGSSKPIETLGKLHIHPRRPKLNDADSGYKKKPSGLGQETARQ